MKIIVVYQANLKNGMSTTGSAPFDVPDLPLTEKEFCEIRQKAIELNEAKELVILNLIPLRED